MRTRTNVCSWSPCRTIWPVAQQWGDLMQKSGSGISNAAQTSSGSKFSFACNRLHVLVRRCTVWTSSEGEDDSIQSQGREQSPKIESPQVISSKTFMQQVDSFQKNVKNKTLCTQLLHALPVRRLVGELAGSEEFCGWHLQVLPVHCSKMSPGHKSCSCFFIPTAREMLCQRAWTAVRCPKQLSRRRSSETEWFLSKPEEKTSPSRN